MPGELPRGKGIASPVEKPLAAFIEKGEPTSNQ